MTTVTGVEAGRARRRRWIGLAGLLLLLAALAVWRLGSRADAAAAPATPGDALPALELADADLALASAQPIARRLAFTGTLAPVTQATLKSRVDGVVLEAPVREGQAVCRGELLARIDLRTAGANRDAASAALDKARADRALARLNYDNSQKLVAEHFVSQNAVDSARASYEAALATEKSAEAQLRLATHAVEDAAVRAPFDGVVARRAVQVGEKVALNSELYTLVDLSRMQLDAPVPTGEVPAIHVGQTARFKVDGFGGRDFEATVWRINPLAEQGSRAITVYFSVPNPDGLLRGGMFAEGALQLDAGTPRLAVPVGALRDEAGVAYVWQVDGGRLRRRHVVTGLRSTDEGRVEIRDGLQAGDRVLIAPIEGLREGAEVRVHEAGAAGQG